MWLGTVELLLSAPPCVSFRAMKNGRPRPTHPSARRYTLVRPESFSRPMTGHTPRKLPFVRRNLPHHRSARAVFPYTRPIMIPSPRQFVKYKFRRNHKVFPKNSAFFRKLQLRRHPAPHRDELLFGGRRPSGQLTVDSGQLRSPFGTIGKTNCAYRLKSAKRQIGVCRCASKFPVIANQSADWCGNPPVERNQVTITTINRGEPVLPGAFRYISHLSGGLPRQCAHWLAMTGNLKAKPPNNNLSFSRGLGAKSGGGALAPPRRFPAFRIRHFFSCATISAYFTGSR